MDDETMLTTRDNPFNPFDDFITWFKYDNLLGHNTCGLLALNAAVSPNVSEEINEKYIDDAMKYMVSQEPEIFRIVKRSDFAPQLFNAT